MLDVLGRGYVADCCIAAYNERLKRENFEIYLTDAAAALVNLFAEGSPMKRYYDIIHPKPEEKRTGAEIVQDIIARHGLKEVM